MGLNVHYALVVLLTPLQLLVKEGLMLYFAITIFGRILPYCKSRLKQVQGSAQTSPSQDRQIFLYRTGIEESQPPLTSLLSPAPLNSNVLSAVGARAGAASEAAELRKHTANDAKCAELGWVSIPLVVQTLRQCCVGPSSVFF